MDKDMPIVGDGFLQAFCSLNGQEKKELAERKKRRKGGKTHPESKQYLRPRFQTKSCNR